jgi:hypothetical protein
LASPAGTKSTHHSTSNSPWAQASTPATRVHRGGRDTPPSCRGHMETQTRPEDAVPGRGPETEPASGPAIYAQSHWQLLPLFAFGAWQASGRLRRRHRAGCVSTDLRTSFDETCLRVWDLVDRLRVARDSANQRACSLGVRREQSRRSRPASDCFASERPSAALSRTRTERAAGPRPRHTRGLRADVRTRQRPVATNHEAFSLASASEMAPQWGRESELR